MTDTLEAEFYDLKHALISPDTMFYHPDWNSPFELHTNASKNGIGTVLAQWNAGILCPMKSASLSFTPVECWWPTTHQELFAVKYSLEHFLPYLLGRKVTIITNHTNLQWLTSINLNLPGGVLQWQNLILQLNIVLTLPKLSQMYLVVNL